MYRAFPMDFRGFARVWFNKLEAGSIGSFVQLSRAFIDNFIKGQHKRHPPTHLFSVSPSPCRTLRMWVGGSSGHKKVLLSFSGSGKASPSHGNWRRKISRRTKRGIGNDTFDYCHEKMKKIGTKLSPAIKHSIIQFLKANKVIFAWSHEYMPRIDPKVVSYKLNVDQALRLVK